MKTLILLMVVAMPILPNKGEFLCNINNDKVRHFVSEHWEASLKLYLEEGIPMAISLSQWILESGYGCSHAARTKNNFGGIKVYKNGKKINRTFRSKKEFYAAYAEIFKQECYLSFQPQTLNMWLEALSFPCCSYARSNEYISKLKRIIKLYEFDRLPT
jgi:hypothetical protein